MPQRPKVIDVRQSYQPVDPASWIPTSFTNERTDSPDVVDGAVAYDGKNFLPTAYGYRSFFGLSMAWDSVLADSVQELIFFQLDSLENIAVALAASGIWIKYPEEDWLLMASDRGGDALGVPDNISDMFASFDPSDPESDIQYTPEFKKLIEGEDIYYPWTYAIIENELYAFRAGASRVWKISASPTIAADLQQTINFKSFEELAGTTGDLGAGVYEAMYRLVYYEKTAKGEWAEVYSSMEELGTAALTSPTSGFHIRLLGLSRAAKAIEIYYKKDGGAQWFKERLTPAPLYDISILWETPGLPIEIFPPAPTILKEGHPSSLAPTFLNMGEQQGIFRAGFQLAFWDSTNAIAVSSINNLADFTPSIETMAAITTYSKIIGKIVAILPEGNNFIIYATRSIIRCIQNISAGQSWEPKSITQISGIAYPGCVTTGNTEEEHYVYTASGIARVSDGRIEYILPDLFDQFRAKDNEVVFLKMIAGRYLFFSSTIPVFSPVLFEQKYIAPTLLQGEGSGCTNLGEYAALVRKNGPTFLGEISLLNYYLSGKPGIYSFGVWGFLDGAFPENAMAIPYPSIDQVVDVGPY